METIDAILDRIEPLDNDFVEQAKEHTAQLVMPPRALGRLHDISEKLCGIGRTLSPTVARKAVVVMAGDHGVVAEGVSAFPQEVTGAMIRTFLAGGAGINALAGTVGAEVYVVDVGAAMDLDPATLPNPDRLFHKKIAYGTKSFVSEPAMTADQAARAVITGYEVARDLFASGCDVLGTGDMGIGNTTPSAAVGAAITGTNLDIMVGPGTGVDADGLARKKEAINRALTGLSPDPGDGLDVLAKVGGYEIGGIAGMILAAAAHRKPVVVDGFISTAGALIAATLSPTATDYMFSGHRSAEPGHDAMLKHLGLLPVLDLGMRLGEGTGAALAMNILEAATAVQTRVMTFAEAQVG